MKRYFFPHRFAVNPGDVPTVKMQAMGAALDRLKSIEHRLNEVGPFALGQQRTLVDFTLAYWTLYIDEAGKLEQFPAIKRCQEMTRGRPRVREKFEFQKKLAREYAEMQDRGEGVQ